MLDQTEKCAEEPRMAESVTRHAQIPCCGEGHVLLCGIDTLDLGLFVKWGGDWNERLDFLNSRKLAAQQENGGLLLRMPSGRKFTFHAGGKGNNYRFHLEFPEYHIFLGKSASFNRSPNVFVSVNARTLWQEEIWNILEDIETDLKVIGCGVIHSIRPSRCDLSVDFLIPGGLTLEFIINHKVTRSRKWNPRLNGDKLETFYSGDTGAPIYLRIYHKSLEVLQNGKKNWFWELWDIQPCMDVWRVEFQLRRLVLKQYGINTLEELHGKIGGVWKDLTEKWFTLRLQDNESTERRSLHPLWKTIQECAGKFGPALMLKRNLQGANGASVDWHVSHIDGVLASFAARRGIDNRADALRELALLLNRRDEAVFTKKAIKKAISLGTSKGGVR